MDDLQQRMIGERLSQLLAVVNQIGPELMGNWVDTEGNEWFFKFERACKNIDVVERVPEASKEGEE